MKRVFANSRWILVFLTATAVAQAAGERGGVKPSAGAVGATGVAAEQRQPATQQPGLVDRAPQTAEPQKKTGGGEKQPEGITLNFQDAPLMDLVKFVADAMGLPVIAETEITGRVSVYNARPVNLQQTLAICNSVLKARGLVAFRSGNVLKVVPLGDAKRHEIAVKHVEQAGDVPETDTIETYVIPLRFADATRLKEDLKDLIGSYGSITADAASNTIIITDTGKNVRRLVTILRSIDARLSQDLTIRVFVLANADATELANVILQVFRGDPRRHQQRFSPWMYRRGASPQAGGSSAVRADVNVVADARTNSLIVTASKDSMELISSLVEQLDVQPQAALEEIRVFTLTNADAADLARALTAFFKVEQKPAAPAPQGPFSRYRFFARGPTAIAARVEEVRFVADERTNSLFVSAPRETMPMIAELIKSVDANPAADEGTLVVPLKYGDAEQLARVLNDLFEARRRPSAVRSRSSRSSRSTRSPWQRGRQGGPGLLRPQPFRLRSGLIGPEDPNRPGGRTVTLAQAEQTEPLEPNQPSQSQQQATEVGISGRVFVVPEPDTNSLVIRTDPRLFERVLEVVRSLDQPPPQVAINVVIAELSLNDELQWGFERAVFEFESQTYEAALGVAGGDIANFSVISNNADLFLRALESEGRLDVLSRPHIITSNNQQAQIQVGQEVPRPTSQRETSGGSIVASVDYETVGVLLTVTPHINPDGFVTLDVSPEISELTAQTVQITDTFWAPVFARRSAETHVTIKDGQTVIIAGLFREMVRETVHKVPFFGDIPGIGLAFQSFTKEREKTELLIFLTPTVIRNETEAADYSGTIQRQTRNESLMELLRRWRLQQQSRQQESSRVEDPPRRKRPD